MFWRKFKLDWSYAMGELAIVTVGVLIALGINEWNNEHNQNHLVRGYPILVMDVWEHAYMPQWDLNRAKYIDVFFKNIDWQMVEERYRVAVQVKEQVFSQR